MTLTEHRPQADAGGQGGRQQATPSLVSSVRRRGSGRIEGLDGLRAIAVLSVLVFHLSPSTLPGGFLGVDVFFVVSGFLITTLLLREIAGSGRIDLLGFWVRRARRLLPALVLVVTTSTAVSFLVDRELLVGIGRQVLGALTFSSNWVEIIAGTSYFARTSPQLFLNFWSLAVEEQFYLFWPLGLVLLLALTRTWRTRMLVAATLAAASALAMATLVSPGEDATRVYYGTDTHVFGLMTGVALAFSWAGRRTILRSEGFQRLRGPIAATALLGLLGLMLGVSETSVVTYRGGILLASLLTAAAIAALLGRPTRYRRLMQARPLAWVGERSYGIYLWHWPVLLILTAALPPTSPGPGRWALWAAVVVSTLVLSELSLRLVETPVRRHGFRACLRSLREAVTGQGGRAAAGRARVALAAAGTVTALAVVACATAPRTSEVQQQIEAGQALVEASMAGAASATATPGPTASVRPRSSASPATSATGTTGASPSARSKSKGEGARGIVAGADYSPPSGAELTGFGDSLMVTSAHGFVQEYPGAQLDAKSIRRWRDGRTQVSAMLAQGTVRRGVVLAFGTNAGIEDEALVRGILDDLGPERMIVMVNLHGPADWIPRVNEQMERIAADYENVAVADWDTVATKHPDYLQSDRIHPGITGGVEYVQLIERTFDELSRDLTVAQKAPPRP